MSFDVDTGQDRAWFQQDVCEIISNAVADALSEDASQAQVDDLAAQMIIGDLRGPKTLKTVRAHMLRLWPLIAPLADREPELFDQIILEFAEIATSLG